MKACKLFRAAQITVYSIYTVIHIQNIQEHVGHLLNLRQGECKKQQQDGDDTVDGIFISKVKINFG